LKPRLLYSFLSDCGGKGRKKTGEGGKEGGGREREGVDAQ